MDYWATNLCQLSQQKKTDIKASKNKCKKNKIKRATACLLFFLLLHISPTATFFCHCTKQQKCDGEFSIFFFKLTKRKQNNLCHLMISLIWFSGPESSAPSDCVCNFLLAPKESCHQVEWFHFNWKIFFLLIWIFVVPVHFLTKSLKCGDWGETWWDLVTKMGLDGTWWLLLDLVRGSLKNFFLIW